MLMKSSEGTYATMLTCDPNIQQVDIHASTKTSCFVAIPSVAHGMMTSDRNLQLVSTVLVRRLLGDADITPIQEVIDAGVLQRLVEFAQDESNDELQYEAIWALTNIACGTTENVRSLVDAGAVPVLVRMLTSENSRTRDQAIWALGNIAGDSPVFRNLVLWAGMMEPLLNITNGANISLQLLRNTTWVMSVLLRGEPSPDNKTILSVLPTLVKFIHSADKEVISNSCWGISYISAGGISNIQILLDTGICPRLLELMLDNSMPVRNAAARTIGNFVTGNDLQTQIVINFNAMPVLHTLLVSDAQSMVKQSLWAVGNIAAGTKEQVQCILDEEGMSSKIIDFLSSTDRIIRKEAALAVANVASKTDSKFIKHFIEQGCMRPFCALLSDGDDGIVNIVLRGFEKILEIARNDAKAGDSNIMEQFVKAGGPENLKKLDKHDDEDIRNRSRQIRREYLVEEKEDDNDET